MLFILAPHMYYACIAQYLQNYTRDDNEETQREQTESAN